MTEIDPVPAPRRDRVTASARAIARDMGHGYLGVEHLFLAIIRDRDAVPTQVLRTLVSLDDAETRLLDLMASPGYRTPSSAPQA